ncbi:MAG: phosphoglycerate mutase [Rhodoferax sp.]|nr:phosphoglycerate mutase [Rhodoferax sp.]
MHLLIPFAASHSDGAVAALSQLQLPHLQKLLTLLSARSAQMNDALSLSPPHEYALAQTLGLPSNDGHIPWAALYAQQELDSPSVLVEPGQAWGFITLCHWQVNTNHMVMSHLPLPGLTPAQSDDLLAAMQPYFAEDGITLHADQSGRYLAQSPLFSAIASASLDRVVGRNLEHWMPDATRAGTLLRLQNEMQMLFYTHPVNTQREALGLPPVNSFWLSGTGALPAGYTAPEAATQPVVVDALRAAALGENWAAWQQAWQTLDTTDIQPLLTAAQRGQPVVVTLCGERGWQSWHTQALSPWQKLKRLFGVPPLQDILKAL